MTKMRWFALALAVCAMPVFASGWSVQTIKKENKADSYVGTTTYDLAHKDHAGSLNIIKTGDGRYIVAVDSGGPLISCKTGDCSFVAKFGDGQDVKYLAYLVKGNTAIMPSDAKRFAIAMSKVDELRVDLQLPGIGARQLVFQVKDAPIVVTPDPPAPFMKYPFGEHRDNIAGLGTGERKGSGEVECDMDQDAGLFVSFPIKAKVKACFANDRLAFLVFNVPKNRKSDLAALDRGLNAVYGKPSGGGEKMWPSADLENSGRQWHSSASIWDMGNALWYIYSDDSVKDLPTKTR